MRAISTPLPPRSAALAAQQAPPAAPWQREWLLVIPLALCLTLWLSFLPDFRYQINPDGVCYLSIARQYLHGQFAYAVNAYWSPLYCWLLVPLLAAGLSPLLATKVLGLLLALVTLVAVWLLGGRLQLNRELRLWLTCALAPAAVYFALWVITPDLLMAATVLLYLAALTSPTCPAPPGAAVRCGTLMGVCYLAKAYALPLVLLHFLLSSAVLLLTHRRQREMRRRVVRSTALALLAFAAVCLPWVLALSLKYGQLTAGSAGRYNFAINGYRQPGDPMSTEGLLPPPNPTAVSMWDDPSNYHLASWNPFGSPAEKQYLWQLVQRNAQAAVQVMQDSSSLAWVILMLALFVAAGPADPRPQRPALAVVLMVLLCPSGYLLLHVQLRYVYLLPLLLALLGVFLVHAAAAHNLVPGFWRKRLALLLMCGSLLWYPLSRLQNLGSLGPGRDVAELAGRLRDTLPAGAAVASDRQWGPSLFLAFHLDLHYYGLPRPGSSTADFAAELRRSPIEYLLAWESPDFRAQCPGASDITPPGLTSLRVYRLPQYSTSRPAAL